MCSIDHIVEWYWIEEASSVYCLYSLEVPLLKLRELLLMIFIAAGSYTCADDIVDPAAGERPRGFNIFLWNSRNWFETNDFTANIRRLKANGANMVFLCPYLFVSDIRDSIPRRTTETISDAELVAALRIVRSNGMIAGLKPHVDCHDWTPRYLWNPTNHQVAQSNYRFHFEQFSLIAEAEGVEYFVVGTELDKIAAIPDFIPSVIRTVRSNFTGWVTYAASWNHFFNIDFWDRCDYIGVNALWHLSTAATPQVSDLLRRWMDWVPLLRMVSDYYGRPVFMTENGYMNIDYCADNPGDFMLDKVDNEQAQANCYRAVIEVFRQNSFIRGLTFWNWELNTGGTKIIDYTPEAKLAETVLSNGWSGL